MTKIEKTQKLFELKGTTDYFKRRIEGLRHPDPQDKREFLSISTEEESAVLLEMAEFEANRWTEEELDETIQFLENSAGQKFMDYAAEDECVKVFNAFLKKKIAQLPKLEQKPVFYTPGNNSVN